jgi:hypothetical protein
VLNIVTHTGQDTAGGVPRRTAGHGGPRRTMERHGGQASTYATVYCGMQGAMSVAGTRLCTLWYTGLFLTLIRDAKIDPFAPITSLEGAGIARCQLKGLALTPEQSR